jgi:hypothetical protein
MGKYFYKLSFQYIPEKEESRAALNFHLTKREKKDIAGALDSDGNKKIFDLFKQFMKAPDTLGLTQKK